MNRSSTPITVISRVTLAVLLACGLTLGMAGCDTNDGPAEETGEAIDEGVEETGEAIEETAEEAEDEIDDATDGGN